MKIFHTADWHIGQSFYGYERYKEHEHFLNWLYEELNTAQANVLLISGDVFDSPNPSASSQKLYYTFLKKITNKIPSLQIVITAGNHDSAARLEAPNPLLAEMNVRVSGLIARDQNGEIDLDSLLIPLYSKDKLSAICAAVPYLRQGDYPPSFTYAQGVASLYLLLRERAAVIAPSCPIVMMGHLQLSGAEISENDRSERIVVGGLDAVPSSVFPSDIAYGALGHLHRAQQVAGRFNLRYAGSPFPMSFAENRNIQGVTVVNIEGQETKIERLEYQPLTQVKILSKEAKPIDGIITLISELPNGGIEQSSPYLEIKILMNGPDPTYRYRIEKALEGKSVKLARIVPVYPKQETENGDNATATDLHEISPGDLASKHYEFKYGSTMPEGLQQLLQEVLKEVNI